MKLLAMHAYFTFFLNHETGHIEVDAAHLTFFERDRDRCLCLPGSGYVGKWFVCLCVCVCVCVYMCEAEDHRYTAAGNVHSLTLCSFILVIIIPPSNQKGPDSIMILPKGIR